MNSTLLNIYDHDRGRTLSTYPSKAIDPTSGINRALSLFTLIFKVLISYRTHEIDNCSLWMSLFAELYVCQWAMVERGCLVVLGSWSHLWYIHRSDTPDPTSCTVYVGSSRGSWSSTPGPTSSTVYIGSSRDPWSSTPGPTSGIFWRSWS
jgi:hypothetical protein